jgi:hypothetical protein
LIAGALFIGGALFLELIPSWYAAHRSDQDAIFMVLRTVSETTEDVAVAILIYWLLVYIATCLPETAWRLRVTTIEHATGEAERPS